MKNLIIGIMGSVFSLGFPVIGETNTPVDLPKKENIHLFLLAGQSNMAGRGIIEESDKLPHPRVLALDKDGKWRLAVAPIHFDKTVTGVGLATSFAEAIAKRYPNVTIGLVPAACGGSAISTWEPGGYHSQTKSHPWDDAIARARVAMKNGALKGILWHQGESDGKPGLAKAYGGICKTCSRGFAQSSTPLTSRLFSVNWDSFLRNLGMSTESRSTSLTSPSPREWRGCVRAV